MNGREDQLENDLFFVCSLIAAVAREKNISFPNALFEVCNSWIPPYIDDYNCSMYYGSPEYFFKSYLSGEPLKD